MNKQLSSSERIIRTKPKSPGLPDEEIMKLGFHYRTGMCPSCLEYCAGKSFHLWEKLRCCGNGLYIETGKHILNLPSLLQIITFK